MPVMNIRGMKLSAVVFVLLTAICIVPIVEAQPVEGTAHGIELLRQKASTKTEFALDHSMLVLASKLDPNNEDLRRVIAGVNGVAVHSYKFAAAGAYDPAALHSVREEYRSGGWMQVMNTEKDGNHGVTDVWMKLENNAISNVAVLVSKPTEVDLIEVSGSISPVDISHLGGHFGIPKIEGGVMVPNTQGQP